MAACDHALLARSGQHVGQVADAEALPGLQDAQQGLDRDLSRGPVLGAPQAHIAVAARLARVFPEVPQQQPAATLGRFAKARHVAELAQLDLLELRRGFVALDEPAQHHGIARAIGQPGGRREAVAPGAAGLLVVVFQRLGHVQMGHKAHIGLVYAHAEGDGGDHYSTRLVQEALLMAPPLLILHPGVIGNGVDARIAQVVGGGVYGPAGQAVDDPGGAGRLAAQEGEYLALPVGLGGDNIADVGTIEAASEERVGWQAQALHDLSTCVQIRRGRQGQSGDAGVAFAQ